MRARSAFWDLVISQSHRIAVNVDVIYNRATVASGLAVSDGSITLDRTAKQLGRCDLTFAEPLLMPTRTGGLLSPYGYELAVQRGVVYPDGTRELLGLGVFPIQTANPEATAMTTQVSALDRSQLVVDARLEDDYQIPAGTNYATAIRALIDQGVPGLTYQFASTGYTTPQLVFAAQSDRWDNACQMAKSIGCQLSFDGNGTCVLRPEPTFNQQPVWTISDGPGGVLVAAALSLDRGPAYNRVVATGENSAGATIFRGVWTDTNPTSPTYYSGPFGRKPRFYGSPFITTDAQALSAATAIGVAQQGVARSLDFSAVPNPALEPGDPVLVVRDRLGVHEVHIVDTLSFGLAAAGAMSCTSRAMVV